MVQNTKILYQYRDADNYKVAGHVVVAGEMSEAQVGKIIDRLDSEAPDVCVYFIPGQVGLPDLQAGFYKAEIAMADAMIAASDPSDPFVKMAQDLRERMVETKPQWDPDRDHPWHELLTIEPTDEPATCNLSVEDLIRAFETATWDEGYLPPFHEEMLANFEAAQAERKKEEEGLQP